jgi:hypothetical protein
MGGRLVAERDTMMMGDRVPEAGYGWDELVVAGISRTKAQNS